MTCRLAMDLEMTKEEAWTQMSQLLKPSRFHRFGNILLPNFIKAENVDKFASLQLDPTDVWIATYPKAGTTWTQQIVKLIRNRGENDDTTIDESIPWLEADEPKDVDIQYVLSLPKPRAFKTHMPYELMPWGLPSTTPCKYIYVVRNPKDVAVSLFFHYKRYHTLSDTKLDWNLFFRNYLYGNVEFGEFFDHILSWWAHKDDGNILFLMFEDMKKDLPAAIGRIAKFIGVDISDEVVTKVVTKSSFEAMKSDSRSNYSWSKNVNPGSTPFMRKGEVGDWKNYFTPEQSAVLDRICSERLKGTGLEFSFEL